MISGGGHREGIFFFWFLHVSFAPTCWMIIINLLSYLSTARLSWSKDINIRKWWRRKMVLLSRVTLPHMKTKFFNLTYTCAEPCRVFAAFRGSKCELKIYSIELKRHKIKQKENFPYWWLSQIFTIHLNFSEVETWMCPYPLETVLTCFTLLRAEALWSVLQHKIGSPKCHSSKRYLVKKLILPRV